MLYLLVQSVAKISVIHISCRNRRAIEKKVTPGLPKSISYDCTSGSHTTYI